MSSDLPVKIFRGFPGNIIHICHFNILNTVAVGTDKMMCVPSVPARLLDSGGGEAKRRWAGGIAALIGLLPRQHTL